MKKTLAMVALIAGAMCMTSNTAMAASKYVEQSVRQSGVVELGSFRVNLYNGETTVRIDCPVSDPRLILGTMPNLPWSLSGGDIVVDVSSLISDPATGNSFSFDIDIRMNDGVNDYVGYYRVYVTIR